MILANENIDARIISFLGTNNIEVYSIAEKKYGISDEEVISFAITNQLTILTEDKDFGEWVFAHGIKDCSILFLRYIFKDFQKIAQIILEIIKTKSPLENRFITMTTDKVRIRKI